MREIIGSILLLLLIGCSNGKRTKSNFPLVSTDTTNVQKLDTVQTVVKDSIDILIEEREKQTFNGTIFAGLKLGCSETEYNRIISKFEKEFNNSIYIKHYKDSVSIIPIDYIHPNFYNNKLYELNVYINNTDVFIYLSSLLKEKFGASYWYIWEYNNLNISIDIKFRRLYQSTNTANLYYDNYYENICSNLTKEPSYIHIKYSDLELLKQIKKDKLVKDSLQRIKEHQINQEKVRKAEIQKDLI